MSNSFDPMHSPPGSLLPLAFLNGTDSPPPSYETPKGSNLPLFRGTPSPNSSYCVARRLLFPQATALSIGSESIEFSPSLQSRSKLTQLCLSKVDEFRLFNQNLHQLISDIQRSRSEIKTGFSAADLKGRIHKLDREISEYENSIVKIFDFFKFITPDDTIQTLKDQVSLAAALVDPPPRRRSLSAKMREETKEGKLWFKKDSFLNMALESLRQSVEILKAYDRAYENGFPLPEHICMPKHQEQISNRLRFVGSNYKIGRFLGEGAWGRVNVIDLGGKEYAIKRSISDDGDDGLNNVFDREIMVPLVLEHENIIKISAVHDGNPILEFIPTGSLDDYFKRGHFLKDTLIVEVLAKIASGLSHMHEKGLIHKDIKPANILLKYEGDHPVPLIIDFGMTAPREHSDNNRRAGSKLYMSPEMSVRCFPNKFSNSKFLPITPAVDVWALGHLIYEMVSDGSNLFNEQSISIEKLKKKKGTPFNFDFLVKSDQGRRKKTEKMLKSDMRGNTDPVNAYSTDCISTQGRENPFLRNGLFEIAADCLSLEPQDRPSCKEVEHRLLALKDMLEHREAAYTIGVFARRALARLSHMQTMEFKEGK